MCDIYRMSEASSSTALISTDIGDRLALARHRARLSVLALSKLSGIDRGTLTNYERGQTRVTLEALQAYATHCGETIGWLIDGSTEGGPTSRWMAIAA